MHGVSDPDQSGPSLRRFPLHWPTTRWLIPPSLPNRGFAHASLTPGYSSTTALRFGECRYVNRTPPVANLHQVYRNFRPEIFEVVIRLCGLAGGMAHEVGSRIAASRGVDVLTQPCEERSVIRLWPVPYPGRDVLRGRRA